MKIGVPRSPRGDYHLRQLERSDIDEWYAYLSDPLVVEHTSWSLSAPEDLQALFESIESSVKTSSIRLAIVDSINNAFIGTIGFHTVSDIHCSAEIAYDLSRPYWGRGIATSACLTVTEWGFADLGFVRIQATTLESNLRSEAVLLKCGFKYEGLLRGYRQVRGAAGNFKSFSRLNTD